jgi:peptidoglycan/xylan/chitin deacetylase (PgdA/CDA1 family)
MRAVMFHNVLSEPLDAFDRELSRIHVNRFRRSIDFLRQRYEVLSLPEAIARMDAGNSTAGALVITFDDGFSGVYEVALPVLAEAGLCGSVFILTEAGTPIPPDRLLHFEQLEIAFRLTPAQEIDVSELGLGPVSIASERERVRALGRIKWELKRLPAPVHDRIHRSVLHSLGVAENQIVAFAGHFPKYRKLSSGQIAELLKMGWTVGGHTRTHPSLSFLDETAIRSEIEGNLHDLQSAFGSRSFPFAYPYGIPELVGMDAPIIVREAGFCCAFTTVPDDNGSEADRFFLSRFSDTALLAELTVPKSFEMALIEAAL